SWKSKCYGNLGAAYRNLGNFKKAIEYYEKALEIAIEIGDKFTEALIHLNIALDFFDRDVEKAKDEAEKTKALIKEIGIEDYPSGRKLISSAEKIMAGNLDKEEKEEIGEYISKLMLR
ncbi:MAG: hypothetical protein DRN17_00825, partial [Thermoplasmata archaeon]